MIIWIKKRVVKVWAHPPFRFTRILYNFLITYNIEPTKEKVLPLFCYAFHRRSWRWVVVKQNLWCFLIKKKNIFTLLEQKCGKSIVRTSASSDRKTGNEEIFRQKFSTNEKNKNLPQENEVTNFEHNPTHKSNITSKKDFSCIIWRALFFYFSKYPFPSVIGFPKNDIS